MCISWCLIFDNLIMENKDWKENRLSKLSVSNNNEKLWHNEKW